MSERYIGLMSGTSMDAIDGVLISLDGHQLRHEAFASTSIPTGVKNHLLSLCRPSQPHSWQLFASLDVTLGRLFAETANRLLNTAGITNTDVLAIGSHGQTVFHQPEGDTPTTVQIGDPNIIAERTSITTVADFRRRDMAAGGQGAPLVCAFHQYIFSSPSRHRAVLNIGGIANITLLARQSAAPATGFDTGPGNVLMDLWASEQLGAPLDEGGRWAASGNVNQQLLAAMSDDDYFALPPPKSTGREHFNRDWLMKHICSLSLPPQDIQSTLCELTAVTVADEIMRAYPQPEEVLVCGGGVHNNYLLSRLAQHLTPINIFSTAETGIDPGHVEATAFAWLAKRTLEQLPGNVPTVTGARKPVILGGIYAS